MSGQTQIESGRQKTVFSGLGVSTGSTQQTVQQASTVANKVRVVHGANSGYYALSGKTIGDVRKGLKDAFSLPGDAIAEVDGKTVGDDFILAEGQNLEFSKLSGRKG